MVEVLIAGAGPAGAAAAILLARAGVRVLLVDRAKFPRDKLCGDTLNPGALRIVERLDRGVRAAIDARGLALRGMVVTGARGEQVRGLYPAPIVGRSLTRRDFDERLVRAAVDAGVQFQEQVRAIAPIVDEQAGVPVVRGAVLATHDGRRLRVPALLTIAADGRRSALAFALGLAWQPVAPRRWVVGGYFESVEWLDAEGAPAPSSVAAPLDAMRASAGVGAASLDAMRASLDPRVGALDAFGASPDRVGASTPSPRGLPAALGEMHIRADHYIGVAPLPNGLANACLVSASRDGFARPDVLLTARLAADPLLRDRFARARLVAPVALLGPLAVDAPVAGAQGLLLAGDAAGFIDPMTGDGLRFALRGGELAAETAREFLDAPELPWHDTLTRRRAEAFGAKQRFNRAVRALVSSPRAVRTAGRAAALAPSLLRPLINYAADLQTP